MPYVGCCPSGQSVEKRFKEHLGGFGGAKYLTRAIKKYGKDWFTVEQIDAGNTPEQCLELEKCWIKRLGTFGAGYNLTVGGENPPRRRNYQPLSDGLKAKLSAAHKGQKPTAKCIAGTKQRHAADPDIVRRLVEFNRGSKRKPYRPMSAESRKNMSRVPWNKGLTKQIQGVI